MCLLYRSVTLCFIVLNVLKMHFLLVFLSSRLFTRFWIMLRWTFFNWICNLFCCENRTTAFWFIRYLLLGRSQTSTQTHHWFKLREWTPRRRSLGTQGKRWLTSTRPKWRRMAHTTVAFGERWPGLMVTLALFVLSSSPTFHLTPW